MFRSLTDAKAHPQDLCFPRVQGGEHFSCLLRQIHRHRCFGGVDRSPVSDQVLIVDDVITAGTAIREAVEIICTAGGQPSGVLLALDRQEKGTGELSAVQEVRQQFDIPVASIIELGDLIAHLENDPKATDSLAAVVAYRERYGS